MGTRSLTRIMDGDSELLCIYRHCDGYPSGHGEALVNALANRKIVNGIGDYTEAVFNGMRCLAASVIAALKDGPGGIYVYPVGSKGHGEEYTYIVRGKIGEEPTIEIEGLAPPMPASQCAESWKSIEGGV